MTRSTASTLSYISAADVAASLPDLTEQLEIAEKALIAMTTGAAEVPPKYGVHPRPDAVIHAMPALARDRDIAGMKLISTYPANAARGMPPIDALILLHDPETGRPTHLLDGRAITALRTAAVSGVAMRLYRPGSVETIVLIGAGTQGRTHAAMVGELFPGASLHIIDRHAERAEKLAQTIASGHKLASVTSGTDWPGAVAQADMVITGAALGSASQILSPGAVRPGALVVAIDHDTFASAELAKAADVFAVDDLERFAVYIADGAFPGYPPPSTSLGAALAQRDTRTLTEGALILVTPLGFGLTDVLFADAVRRRAEAAGLGLILER